MVMIYSYHYQIPSLKIVITCNSGEITVLSTYFNTSHLKIPQKEHSFQCLGLALLNNVSVKLVANGLQLSMTVTS